MRTILFLFVMFLIGCSEDNDTLFLKHPEQSEIIIELTNVKNGMAFVKIVQHPSEAMLCRRIVFDEKYLKYYRIAPGSYDCEEINPLEDKY